MANIKTFTIYCINDKSKNPIPTKIKVDLDTNSIMWGAEHSHVTQKHQIVSGRLRYDNQWGWQCSCGASDIQSQVEKRAIADPRMPAKPQELHEVIKNMKPEKPKFQVGVN